MSAYRVKRWMKTSVAVVLLAAVLLLAGMLQVLPTSGPAGAFAADPPRVVSVSPADGARGCPITQVFRVTFDQDMDPTTLSDATLYIYPSGGTRRLADVQYDAATRTATVTPKQKLEAGRTYHVTLGVNVRSTSGQQVLGAPLSWEFHTVPAVAPRVLAKTPADGAVNCPLTQVMTITFDSEMDPESINTFSFYFAKRGGGVYTDATVTYDPVTLTATLTPGRPLEEATRYDVTLLGKAVGSNGVLTYGTPMVWSFTTVLAQPPVVATKAPSDGATGQPLDTPVTIAFDSNVDKRTITADTFYLQKVGGERVDTVLTANERGATLTPKADLEPETAYQVTLTIDVKNAKGLSVVGAPMTWTFTTGKLTSPFSDVSTSHRYFTAVYHLSKRDVIGGFTDGTFRPGALVTRQQYAKMIVRALGLPVTGNETNPFGDVVRQSGADPLYPSKYIAVGAARGIILGKTVRIFAPYDNITRFQAITMVIRGIDAINRGLLNTPGASYRSTWDPALSVVHGQNARLAEFNGLLEGLPLAQLDPSGPMTRGEIAQLMWNLMRMLR